MIAFSRLDVSFNTGLNAGNGWGYTVSLRGLFKGLQQGIRKAQTLVRQACSRKWSSKNVIFQYMDCQAWNISGLR